MTSMRNRLSKLESALEAAAGRAMPLCEMTDHQLMAILLEDAGLSYGEDAMDAALRRFDQTGELPHSVRS
jgi:hypothetical protein